MRVGCELVLSTEVTFLSWLLSVLLLNKHPNKNHSFFLNQPYLNSDVGKIKILVGFMDYLHLLFTGGPSELNHVRCFKNQS